MTNIDAVLLAFVQGLTEFLPVSSSGHLVLAHHWFGSTQEVDFLFDILLHIGTLIAVLVFFRKDVSAIILGAVGKSKSANGVFSGWERRALVYILLSAVPTAIIGFGINSLLLPVLLKPLPVGIMLICTGIVLWSGRNAGKKALRGSLNITDVLILGVVQGIAVIPGISRAGVTIVAGMLLGLRRDLAVRFSLLMSVPAVIGAALLALLGSPANTDLEVEPYLLGVVVAMLVGYGAIAVILHLVERDRLHIFAYYLWLLGFIFRIS